MHVDGGCHIWLCRLRHMVMSNSVTPYQCLEQIDDLLYRLSEGDDVA